MMQSPNEMTRLTGLLSLLLTLFVITSVLCLVLIAINRWILLLTRPKA